LISKIYLVPPAPPLPSINRGKAKSSHTSSSSSTPTESSLKAATSGKNAGKPSTETTNQRSALRRLDSDEKNKYGRQTSNQTKQPTSGTYNRVTMHDIVDEIPRSLHTSQGRGGKTDQSIFEKVDTHNGHTTYMGTGTFTQLENCISNCLSRNQSHTDITSHFTRPNFGHKSLTRASVLEDYSYEGISAPKYQEPLSSSSHHHYSDHHHSDHHHYADYHHSDHHYSDHHHHHHHADHRKAAAELSLPELREVNDALAQYGIPVFSHHANPHTPHHQPHSAAEIVSACRLLMNEPRLGLDRDGNHAVQHVWDAVHNYQPPTNTHGYASPALRSVASHLFHPNQTPYDPVHAVASHLFNPPQQSSYNPGPPPQNPYYPGPPPQNPYYPGPGGPPQQNSPSSGGSVLSRLFGQPQQNAYNPGPGSPPNIFSGQPQQSPGSPFSNSFHQYPGNNHYMY
jgi:hypothetical protein